MASSSARARARSSFSLCARYNCSSWRSSAARSLASRARRRSSVFSKEWTALLMAMFSSRRLRWFGEMGVGQSRGAGAGSGGDGSGGSFLNGGVAFFRWVGGAGVGRSRLEGGGEVILLPALGLALRLELPQALSLESLREMGGGAGGKVEVSQSALGSNPCFSNA